MKRTKRVSRKFTPAPKTLTAAIYDAIKNAREAYANTKNALSGTVEKCEEFVNAQRATPDALEQFISTGWLKRMPSGHLYIQLA